MTDRKLCFRKSSLLPVFLLMLPFLFQGCAFGYYTYRTINESMAQPAINLTGVKISYFAAPIPPPDTNITSSLVKTLRERFLLTDIKNYEETNNQEDRERIVMRAKLHYHDYPLTSTIWAFVGAFSLATIPAIVDRDATVTFQILAPNGDKKTCQYSFTERFYSWLPFEVGWEKWTPKSC